MNCLVRSAEGILSRNDNQNADLRHERQSGVGKDAGEQENSLILVRGSREPLQQIKKRGAILGDRRRQIIQIDCNVSGVPHCHRRL